MQIFLLRHPVPVFLDLLHAVRDAEPLLKIFRRLRKAHPVDVALKPLIQLGSVSSQIFHVDFRPDPHGIHQRAVQIKNHGINAGEHLPHAGTRRFQRGQLLWGKGPELSHRKGVAQNQRPHGHAPQIGHRSSLALHHPLHLVVLSFRDGKKVSRTGFCRASLQLRFPDFGRSGALLFSDFHTLPQPAAGLFGKRSVRFHIIGFFHMSGRRKQAVCQGAVIRDQKQPLRVLVQPSCRKQILFQQSVLRLSFPHPVQNRPAMAVPGGRQQPRRLIHQIIDVFRVGKKPSVHTHLCILFIHLPGRVLLRTPVHADAPFAQKLLHFAPGSFSHLT